MAGKGEVINEFPVAHIYGRQRTWLFKVIFVIDMYVSGLCILVLVDFPYLYTKRINNTIISKHDALDEREIGR